MHESVQKYINLVFIVVVLALFVYIIDLRVRADIREAQQVVNNQANAIQALQNDVNAIVNFLNQQIGGAPATTQQQAAQPETPAPAAGQ